MLWCLLGELNAFLSYNISNAQWGSQYWPCGKSRSKRLTYLQTSNFFTCLAQQRKFSRWILYIVIFPIKQLCMNLMRRFQKGCADEWGRKDHCRDSLEVQLKFDVGVDCAGFCLLLGWLMTPLRGLLRAFILPFVVFPQFIVNWTPEQGQEECLQDSGEMCEFLNHFQEKSHSVHCLYSHSLNSYTISSKF